MAENKQYITKVQDNGSVMISEDVIGTIVDHAVHEVEGVVSWIKCQKTQIYPVKAYYKIPVSVLKLSLYCLNRLKLLYHVVILFRSEKRIVILLDNFDGHGRKLLQSAVLCPYFRKFHIVPKKKGPAVYQPIPLPLFL